MQFARIAALAAAVGLATAAPARADVTHVVARGHTLSAIARRYHVSVKAIVAANHIKDPRHLRVGQTLVIPGVTAPAQHHPAGAKASHGHAGSPPSFAVRAKTPGVVHVKRLATDEKATLRLKDRRGRVPPTSLKRMEHLMRYPDGETHIIDGRLLSLLAIVSDHFGSRPIEIISGFRPFRPTQYTPHSNHNIGHAVDFRVVGVPDEAVRDFCRTLRNTGCGYYPNSVFVHMDTRASSAYWVDYARPGEPPQYDRPNSGADESGSDVANETHVAAPAEPDGNGSNGADAQGDESGSAPPPADGRPVTAPAASGSTATPAPPPPAPAGPPAKP